MKRLEALAVVDEAFAGHPLVVTCGASARELASLGLRDTHLPLLDSMGLTSAVGLGVALGHPGPVGVLDGDGSLLMGFSILPTLATLAPANLTVVVLDNGQHASAAGVPSQAAEIDLGVAAGGVGLETESVAETDGLRDAIRSAIAADEPRVIVGAIEPGNAADVPFLLEDPAVLGRRFADALSARRPAARPGAARGSSGRVA